MNPILEQFLAEARENLLFLDKNLENLEDGDSEDVNALFRAAHTLKGSSGLAGFDAVKEITHIAEDLLDAYRNDKLSFSSELLDALYDMFDEVTELVDATEESGEIAFTDEDKLAEFKELRENILDVKDEIQTGLDTELTVVNDGEIPLYGDLFKNNFSAIDLDTIPFIPNEVTASSFESMDYYIIDIDLPEDSIEFGNDPFYSLYLLEDENVISICTQVAVECETLQENPILWGTRLLAIVNSNQELLEDAFYNFLEDVTVYPLSLKALFSSELEPQSNNTILDFLEDLKDISNSGNIDQLKNITNKVTDILNPGSLQGFLFNRLNYILENSELNHEKISTILNYILEQIGIEDGITISNDELTIDDEIIEDINQPVETIQEVEETIVDDTIDDQEYHDSDFNFNLEEKEVRVVLDIITQQKDILNIVENENTIIQVKSTLSKLEDNLYQNFALDIYNDKDSLLNLIDKLIRSLTAQYHIEVVQPTQTNEAKKEEPVLTKTEEIQIIAPEESKVIPQPEIKQTQSVQSVKKEEPKEEPKEKKAIKPIAKTVKVDLQDIDSMMDIVGEMLVIKNSLPYIADALNVENVETSKRDLVARYDEINRVTSLLQEKVMEMRLLSLSFIFDRYPKLVRDISKSLGKKIRYEEFGGDTKLDKTVIEKLADPLIHIIRNSLDHGIEDPETRKSKGKDPEGTISIKAQSVGDKVYVYIQDDGKGIDVDKVVQKSLEKKMVDPDKLDFMTHEEKLLLIFGAGVSTMDEISELSGRGVGMDVVRQTIDDVGGKISIKSEIDLGTTLTLELPMSVALTNVFHVKLGDVNYALSMDTISETVQIPVDEVEYVNKKPMLKLRGSLIPLIFNYKLLSKDVDKKDNYSLLIIETQDSKFGFVVDQFVNQLDIVQKPLASNLYNHPFISGTSLLGNGEVLFVINPSKLINLKEKK